MKTKHTELNIEVNRLPEIGCDLFVPVSIVTLYGHINGIELSKVIISIGTYGTIVVDGAHSAESNLTYRSRLDWLGANLVDVGSHFDLGTNWSKVSCWQMLLAKLLADITKDLDATINVSAAWQIIHAVLKDFAEIGLVQEK